MRRRPAPVVVTDLHEPLIVVHRRLMRRRAVLFGVWTVGWIVSGLLWRTGWLATTILFASGPGVWLFVAAWTESRRPGRRQPVVPRRRAIGSVAVTPPAPGGPDAGASH